MRIKRLVGAVVAGALATVGLAVAGPAQAACADNWYPGGGKIIESYSPGAGEYTATALFSFSQDEINALRCHGDKYYEVDMMALGGVGAKGGNKTYNSNLPSPYLDVDYLDSVRTLTVGSTSAQSFVAGVEYFTTVHLRNFAVTGARAQVALTFQRSHKVGVSETSFWAVCQAHGGSDPAWCVAPSKSHGMQGELGDASYVDMRLGYTSTISTTWGRYRTSNLTPVNQMVPGDKIFSPNGLNYLLMQSDGNLVEYIPGPRVVWASNTNVPGSVFIAQGDGNYVVVAPGNRPVWASGTKGGGTTLRIQDDRNLVVYAPGNNAIWSNNVAGQP
jgi:hypothetical protein